MSAEQNLVIPNAHRLSEKPEFSRVGSSHHEMTWLGGGVAQTKENSIAL